MPETNDPNLNHPEIAQPPTNNIEPSLESSEIMLFRQVSGPVPPAEDLAQYNNAFPDGARLVFDMALNEQTHRHKIQMQEVELYKSKLNQESFSTNLGVFSGFCVAMFGLYISLQLGLNDQPVLAGAIGTIDLAAMVSVFVLQGKKSQPAQEPKQIK